MTGEFKKFKDENEHSRIGTHHLTGNLANSVTSIRQENPNNIDKLTSKGSTPNLNKKVDEKSWAGKVKKSSLCIKSNGNPVRNAE